MTKKHIPFIDQLRKLKGPIEKHLAGKQFIIIANTGGHSYGAIGSKGKFATTFSKGSVTGSSISRGMDRSGPHGQGNTIQYDEFSLIGVGTEKGDIIEQITNLEEQIDALTKEMEEAKDKLDFIDKHGLNEYDELEIAVLMFLQADSTKDLSEMEKAKKIKLILEEV